MTILVTGAAGFIGSNFVMNWLSANDEKIIALDKLTYAGNLENLRSVEHSLNYKFIKGDICNSKLIASILKKYQPRALLNFAAESHVDRSIRSSDNFIKTNIIGTYSLLEEVRSYYNKINVDNKKKFRFLQVSTDEVYGSLDVKDPSFKECNKFYPNSPYSASKASADHLVRAWHHTYGIPVLTTYSTNNYGPYHYPEKLIPLCILKALNGESLPIYGDGQQVRDWIYVIDHCKALIKVLENGSIGETYNIGSSNERTNLAVIYKLCELLDELKPRNDGKSYKGQIIFIEDRPGHDRRYAIDASFIFDKLGWKPEETFESGVRKTVKWYLDNKTWVDNIKS